MEKENKTQNKVVQTYAEDMAKVIQDDREGLIKKIIHGEQEHEANKMNLSPESKKNRLFMSLGLAFIFISLVTIVYFIFHKQDNTVTLQTQFTPIIFNDQSTFLEVSTLNKDGVFNTILNAVKNTSVKAGGVDGIYLTENKKVVGLRQFLSLIKSSFAPNPDSVFVNENFLLGVANNQSKDFFMIIKVRSVSDIFDSLRAWENKMFFDLHGFFGVDITPQTKQLLAAPFEDGIVSNKNARILYSIDADNNKKMVMMYVFADDNSIVITSTESSAREIMLRLASGQIKK